MRAYEESGCYLLLASSTRMVRKPYNPRRKVTVRGLVFGPQPYLNNVLTLPQVVNARPVGRAKHAIVCDPPH